MFKIFKLFWQFVFIISIFLLLVYWSWPKEKLMLVMCDVGQGDAFLISQGSKQLLVDTGSDSRVLNCLENHIPFWDQQIEYLVLTHYDKDHAGGFLSIVNHYQISNLILTRYFNNTKTFWDIRKAALEKKNSFTHLYFPSQGDRVEFWQDVTGFVLSPDVDQTGVEVFNNDMTETQLWDAYSSSQFFIDDINDQSIALFLQLNTTSVAMMADLPSNKEISLADQNLIGDIDILKVAHHGSKSSSDTRFLLKLQPEISLISAGKNNSYGHPSTQVIDNLKQIHTQIYSTMEDGEVTIEVDQQGYRVVDRGFWHKLNLKPLVFSKK